jgi:peptidoglycan/LPS O-acetylase OafA/YrhL
MHWNSPGDRRYRIPGLGWLRSCGRLSYEIYLTHMFCVYAIVDLARASATDKAAGWAWYPVAIGASWLLGWIVARCFSQPCERRLRLRYGVQAQSQPAAAVAPAEA